MNTVVYKRSPGRASRSTFDLHPPSDRPRFAERGHEAWACSTRALFHVIVFIVLRLPRGIDSSPPLMGETVICGALKAFDWKEGIYLNTRNKGPLELYEHLEQNPALMARWCTTMPRTRVIQLETRSYDANATNLLLRV